jgi:hypothetical protein
MKKIICAATMLLAATSLIFAQNAALQIRATGTGTTTGHIADISLYNPTNQAVTFTLSPSFIPSGGQYQPYIVPTPITSTVPAGTTANVPVNGYCTDITRPPVPAGGAMPPISSWLTASQDPAAAALLDAITRVSTAFDKMKNEGAITTPFSSNPEKEREAVIQQTFWIYAAELSGSKYKKEDFKVNTIKQFETSTGLVFEKTDEKTQSSVNAGIDQFWNTFEAVGAEAKVLSLATTASNSGHSPELIGVNDANCECGDITFDVEVSINGKKGEPEKFPLASGSNVRDTLKAKANAADEIKLTITNLVTKCTECISGPCEVTKDSRKITVTTSGLTNSLDDKKAPKAQVLSGVDIFQPELGTAAAGTDPVRYYITVEYTCKKEKCLMTTCKKMFEIFIEKEPIKKK